LITVPELAAESLSDHLAKHMGRRFVSTDARITELIPLVARLSLECIGNSDALAHIVAGSLDFLADITAVVIDVCFWGKADIDRTSRNPAYDPKGDFATIIWETPPTHNSRRFGGTFDRKLD
jgi:hypothetical protein